MNWPGFCFGLLWIPALGLGMYAWRSRGGWLWLVASLFFAAVGFFMGHGMAVALGWEWGWVGPWALGPAVTGSLLLLVSAYRVLRPVTQGMESTLASPSTSIPPSEDGHG